MQVLVMIYTPHGPPSKKIKKLEIRALQSKLLITPNCQFFSLIKHCLFSCFSYFNVNIITAGIQESYDVREFSKPEALHSLSLSRNVSKDTLIDFWVSNHKTVAIKEKVTDNGPLFKRIITEKMQICCSFVTNSFLITIVLVSDEQIMNLKEVNKNYIEVQRMQETVLDFLISVKFAFSSINHSLHFLLVSMTTECQRNWVVELGTAMKNHRLSVIKKKKKCAPFVLTCETVVIYFQEQSVLSMTSRKKVLDNWRQLRDVFTPVISSEPVLTAFDLTLTDGYECLVPTYHLSHFPALWTFFQITSTASHGFKWYTCTNDNKQVDALLIT